MKNKRKNREAFAEHSYWQSYSDMMAALLLIFVLMIAITLSIYKQKTADLDKTSLELSEAQAKLDVTIADLENSKAELEKSNEELASSLTAYNWLLISSLISLHVFTSFSFCSLNSPANFSCLSITLARADWTFLFTSTNAVTVLSMFRQAAQPVPAREDENSATMLVYQAGMSNALKQMLELMKGSAAEQTAGVERIVDKFTVGNRINIVPMKRAKPHRQSKEST